MEYDEFKKLKETERLKVRYVAGEVSTIFEILEKPVREGTYNIFLEQGPVCRREANMLLDAYEGIEYREKNGTCYVGLSTPIKAISDIKGRDEYAKRLAEIFQDAIEGKETYQEVAKRDKFTEEEIEESFKLLKKTIKKKSD